MGLTSDPKSKVACETATKDNMVMVAGEITTQAKIDYEKVVRGVVGKIGFDSYVDDLSSVDSNGLCKRALVQLSYAIGVAKPLSLFVETYGTEQGALTADDITNIIKMEFDCRP